MSQLFEEDNSDSDFNIQTNTEYAKNYNAWRQKEEFHKLSTKYKNESTSESSSSDDDDEDIQVNESFEKDFFKTLSYLKKKDPRIYDKNFGCFENTTDINELKMKGKKKKEQSMFIKDYERQLILNNEGQLSDDEKEIDNTPTYTEEQNLLKEDLKKVLKSVDDGDDSGDENWGGIFKARVKTSDETAQEENDYKLWLAGQKEHLESNNDETELKPLKDYWLNPKLDEGEKFLRDYILNNRFNESENTDYIPTYDEIVHDSDALSEDEKILNVQEDFEHKYNFRYEEPDQDFIKRYPRTMEQSLRQKDDKRKAKRVERKTRKVQEKQNKMEEIKQLNALKRQEIEEKIKKLQEVTGNNELGFDIKDIDEDFSPEEHDKRMQELFNNEFYAEPEGDIKPEFPELDEELEIEKWDDWRGNEETVEEDEEQNHMPHCEDNNFNMDCDYDPNNPQKDLINNSKKKKKSRRKSKFAKLISEPKPIYNPENGSYEQYLDEYYKLDCEDVIGDIPCRFKYRTVVPNDFGLSVEEILMAKDKELNRWNSLKKTIQIRPEHVEKYDVIAFRKKAQNEYLKRKFIPSLFIQEEEESSDIRQLPSQSSSNTDLKQDTKNSETCTDISKKMKKKDKKSTATKEDICNTNTKFENDNMEFRVNTEKIKKRKELKECSGNLHNRKKMNKKETKVQEGVKNEEINSVKPVNSTVEDSNTNTDVKKGKKRKAKIGLDSTKLKKIQVESTKNNKQHGTKSKKHHKVSTVDIGISNARLEAYGINPKKFKNKLRYGKTKN
ncbi:hypothetical protein FQA39_LY03524 [Lamprigera yunnana]|nr:hypothetical protein FQA39_LY03524 [Lamprigera yunnana]